MRVNEKYLMRQMYLVSLQGSVKELFCAEELNMKICSFASNQCS